MATGRMANMKAWAASSAKTGTSTQVSSRAAFVKAKVDACTLMVKQSMETGSTTKLAMAWTIETMC